MKRVLALVLLAVVAACIHGPLSWSPDGRRFVFSGLLEDDRGEHDRGGIYVFDLDEKSVTRPYTTDVRLSTPVFLDDDRVLFAGPTSSDAPTLLLATLDRNTRRRRALCQLRLKGPAVEEDVEAAAGMIVPSLSEDRTRVAFHVVQQHAPPKVVVVDLLEKTLTTLAEAGLFPVLSLDGKKVSFLAMPGDGRSVESFGERETHPLKGLIDLSGGGGEGYSFGETRISGLAVHDLERRETTLAVRWKGKLDAPTHAVSRDRLRYAIAGRRGAVMFDLEADRAQSFLPGEELTRLTFDRDDRKLLAICEGRVHEELKGALVRVGVDDSIGAVFGGTHVLPVAAFGLAPDRRSFATVHTHPKVRDPLAILHDLSTGKPTEVLLPDLDASTDLLARWSDLVWGADEAELGVFDAAFKQVTRQVGEEVGPDDERRALFAQRLARAREGRFSGR